MCEGGPVCSGTYQFDPVTGGGTEVPHAVLFARVGVGVVGTGYLSRGCLNLVLAPGKGRQRSGKGARLGTGQGTTQGTGQGMGQGTGQNRTQDRAQAMAGKKAKII